MISFDLKTTESGVRVAEVTSHGQTFKTPDATITDDEFLNYIRFLNTPDDPPIQLDHPVAETRDVVDEEDLEMIDENRKVWARKLGKAQQMMGEFRNKIHFYKPEVSNLREDSYLSADQNELLLEFAAYAGFEWATVYDPHPDSSVREFKEHLIEMKDRTEDWSRELDLVVELSIETEGDDLFDKLVAAADLGYDAVSIDFSKFKTKTDRLSDILEFSRTDAGKKTLIYGSSPRIKRYDNNEGDTIRVSVRQLLPLFGVDITSYFKQKGGRGGHQDQEEAKWCDISNARYRQMDNVNENAEINSCLQKCCNDKNPSEVWHDFETYDLVTEKCRLHDSVGQRVDRKRLMNAVLDETVDEYVDQRENLRLVLQTLD